MFLGSFAAGYLPLLCTCNKKCVKVMTTVGTGMLIGTALCIIIPEGIFTTLNAHGSHSAHETAEGGVMNSIAEAIQDFKERKLLGDPPHSEHEHDLPPAAKHIGLALLLGFVFMLVVDRLGGGGGHGHSHGTHAQSSGNSEHGDEGGHGDELEGVPLTAVEGHVPPVPRSPVGPKGRSSADMATLGLLVPTLS
jgi:zinc transporter 9